MQIFVDFWSKNRILLLHLWPFEFEGGGSPVFGRKGPVHQKLICRRKAVLKNIKEKGNPMQWRAREDSGDDQG
jgi:hypothetical protein